MLYTKKFVFTVSLCAMLAVNPVLAVTDPVEAKAGAKSGTPGVVSTVYSDWAGRADSGIAGVRYVNSAVDAAGNAAQWAENHAAAAAQSAKDAATSAAQAASKVAIAQGEGNKNKAMVTNGKGEVSAGYVTSDMISSSGYSGPYSGVLITNTSGVAEWGAIEPGMIDSSGGSGVLIINASGRAGWGNVSSEYVRFSGVYATGVEGIMGIYDGVYLGKVVGTGVFAGWSRDSGASGITGFVADFTRKAEVFGPTGAIISGLSVLTYDASGEMRWGNILPGSVWHSGAPGVLAFEGNGTGMVVTGSSTGYDVLVNDPSGNIKWDKIGPESTTGIVGMVPVGSATATEYGQLWIE